MPRRILITGSSGRLGGTLARRLAGEHEIVQLDLQAPASEAQGELGVVHVGSVNDLSLVAEAMEGVEAVVHCAAYPGAMEPFYGLMETNVLGTFALLEAAGMRAEVGAFICVSSVMWHGLHEEYGGMQSPEYLPIDEEHPSLATGYYDTSKVLAEHLCETYTKRFRKPCVAMRPMWIITEEAEPTFKAAPPSERAHLNDYVGVSDLVAAVRLLLDYEPEDGFEAFLFSADDQCSTVPSVELAERYFPEVRVDKGKLEACGGYGALVDCTRAKERLGWNPKFRCQR